MDTVQKIGKVFNQNTALQPCLCHVESWRSSCGNASGTRNLLQQIAAEWDANHEAQEKHLIGSCQWHVLHQLSQLRKHFAELLEGAGKSLQPDSEETAVQLLHELKATQQFGGMDTFDEVLQSLDQNCVIVQL